MFEIIDLAFSCVLINICALIGLMCTSINIIILTTYNITTDSSNILLVSLSVADFLFCLTIPISRFNCIMEHAFTSAVNTDVNFLQVFSMFSRLFYVISITIGGVIAAERFIVVFFPFSTVTLLTPWRMKVMCVCVYLLNTVLFGPIFFCFSKGWVYNDYLQKFTTELRPTEFYRRNYNSLNIELGVFHNIALPGTSMFLMLCLSPALAIKLWFVVNERSKLTKRSYSFDPLVAKILVTICTANILFYGPLMCFKTVASCIPGYDFASYTYQIFMIITDFSGTLSATTNFLIYFSMSGKFRKKYMSFRAFLCRRQNAD
ncbi:hypothetical protein Btru_043325 [Bulinus truncatus]|nr:hypothetical protein Btru_043325 [Bulinus truncatus]